MRYDPDTINKRFQMIPEEVQDILSSTQTTEKIQEIGKSKGLHVDQVGKVSEEMMYITLGLESATSFAKNLTKYGNIDSDIAQEMVKEISKQIFAPIRIKLQQIQERRSEEALREQFGGPKREAKGAELDSAELGSMEHPLPDTVLTNRVQVPPPPHPEQEPVMGDVAQSALQEHTSLPSEERIVEDEEENPLHARVQSEEPRPNPYRGTDPYREPLQ